MPVKIRLQRHGKKGKPFYWVVAADSRAKRDGKFLEKLGTYNPNTNPATINLDVDGSVKWLNNGAQPTDTARAILSYKGVLLKHHLLGGVRKGALTEEQAEKKFKAWVEEKEKAIAAKVGGLDKAKADAKAKALEAEKEVSAKRAAAALPEVEEEVAEETAPVEEVAEAVVEGTAAVTEEAAKEEVAEPEAKAEEAAPAEETEASKEEE
ncbi:30S ribosomal protein S16 [Flagellimonas sp. HMM57]|uniref:30S ribosomal protein S16 n=1 Tax=unclassified Flagellimonas TaxID=2644544 RepID=UPI0013D1935E|nr:MULTISPECIES: 30S ribosomal protein S16 [unclassified Flagellimonas]UII77138.1 30S ribosomal protein S16 [Flagellimonas sp. HMM57]